MRLIGKQRLLVWGALSFLFFLPVHVQGEWWQRAAATWYYKDDWKGLALSGSQSFRKTLRLEQPAESGWIVVWGAQGYRLTVNGKPAGSNVDGALIDDYSLTPLLEGANDVTLVIEGSRVCAEGEIVARGGKRIPFATGSDWQTAAGGKPQTEKMKVEPSTGAFHRARNGRLLDYNDEERGKSAIAKTFARLQRAEEQSMFLMRRLRPAAEIVSLDPQAAWYRAEQYALPLMEQARQILNSRAVAAQKAGKYLDAQSAAAEAGARMSGAEQAISATTSIYQAERQIAHLENCADLLPGRKDLQAGLDELRQLVQHAHRDHALSDFAAVAKLTGRCSRQASALRSLLGTAPNLVTIGDLDEFPESSFGWLNARALMGSDPGRWPFSLAPSNAEYVDLAGLWQFRTDPNNEGLEKNWHTSVPADPGWRAIAVPCPWQREGFTEDNLKSPGDCPYRLPDRRTGDKPYNGFAWYRKEVFIPVQWKDREVILQVGSIKNWGQVFVGGTALSPGRLDPPSEQAIPRRLLRYGKKNLIAVRVYNHDNFGGILSGPVALYPAGKQRAERETPGPLALVQEHTYPTPSGPVRQALLAGALSPGVVVATGRPELELSGWEAKGHPAPALARFVTSKGAEARKLDQSVRLAKGEDLAENWVLLEAEDRDVLIMLPRRPQEITWERNPLGAASFAAHYQQGPVRAALVVLSAETGIDDARRWARALQRYPVAVSDVVAQGNASDPLARRHSLRYRYLDLGGFGALKPLTVAPVPMLASFALASKNPRVHLEGARPMICPSPYAPYLVSEGTDRLTYLAQAVDRSKMMKGIGELFRGRSPEVFQRMADWGADHVRYAWAFHARWDMPLVRYVGGPVIEDNEAVWKRLDRVVENCNAAGMQMMLTWFFNEDSPQADAGGAVRNSTRYWRQRPEAQKNAFELWRRIAQRYADKPPWAISYDFFNEPAYINRDHWNEIIKELTALIRSVDKTHLIVWESADGWAQPSWSLWMQPSGDPNTLYSFHRYGKHWGYAYDEYYPGCKCTREAKQIDPWLEAILFSIRYNVPIHCGEFGISMIQPDADGLAWLDDYLALFERFGIGWNWWNYAGDNIYRTGLVAGDRVSPNVAVLRKWFHRSGLRRQPPESAAAPQSGRR
jgi:hypothetical protein